MFVVVAYVVVVAGVVVDVVVESGMDGRRPYKQIV